MSASIEGEAVRTETAASRTARRTRSRIPEAEGMGDDAMGRAGAEDFDGEGPVDDGSEETFTQGEVTELGAEEVEAGSIEVEDALAVLTVGVGDDLSDSASAAGDVLSEPDVGAGDALSEPAVGAGDALSEPAVGAGDALSDAEIARAVAALVYASPEPVSERRLQTLLEGPRLERIRAGLEALREQLAASGLPYELRTLAGGFQILTTPDVGEIVQRLTKVRKSERISGAALETLAVVAYRQPVTKAEIEAIRGVQAGPILRTLIERGLVRVSGRADVPGHPLQYGTTREFLDRFGLATLADLPRDGELAKD